MVFWENNAQLPEGAIAHWWGGGEPTVTGAELILSYYPTMYLDTGFNNFLGSNYGPYNDWKQMFEFSCSDRIHSQVIGAEAPLWSEVNTDATNSIKIWPRTGALAQRTWHRSKVLKVDVV